MTMSRFITTVFLVLLAGVAMAGEAEQSDWSGGSGVPGPIAQWEDRFDAASGIGFGAEGHLSLLCEPAAPIQHEIGSGLGLPDAIYAADIDGDGDVDAVGAFWTDDAVYWFENLDGHGQSWARHSVGENRDGPRDLATADLDGDGDIDILGALQQDDQLIWWENEGAGAAWTPHVIDAYLNGCSMVNAADIDGDGDLDALTSSVDVSGCLVLWWENDVSGDGWIEHVITTTAFYPRGLHHGDMDGDGDLDVAVAAWNDHEIAWWENFDGDGITWIKHSVDGAFLGAYTVHCADLNGDGDMDLLGGASQSDQVAWWDNTAGDGSAWTKHLIDTNSLSVHWVMAADVDLDGDLDVLSATYNGSRVTWWRNNGNGSAWVQHTIASGYSSADMVNVGDFDGNGAPDAIAAAYTGGHVDWWRIVEFTDAGSLTSSILDTGETTALWGGWNHTGIRPGPETALIVEARASSDAGEMGIWTELQPGDLSDYLDDERRYLQYRISMSSVSSALSPILHDIRFSWGTITGVPDPAALPAFSMNDPFPNPFNPRLSVEFTMERRDRVVMTVHDAAGRLIRRLADREFEIGTQLLDWDGKDSGGERVAAGIYLVRISTDSSKEQKKVVMLK